MSANGIFITLLVLTGFGFWLGRSRAAAWRSSDGARLHSLPSFHGGYVALWGFLPSVVLLLLWSLFGSGLIDRLVLASLPDARLHGLSDSQVSLLLSQITNLAFDSRFASEDQAIIDAAAYMSDLRRLSSWIVTVGLLALGIALLGLAWLRLGPQFCARQSVERAVRGLMIVCSTLAIMTTIGIVASLFFESLRFFERYSPIDFLFGLQWSPQTAIREDQVGSSGAFGALPVLWGTVFIALIALIVAVPIGLLTAVYLGEYASRRTRSVVKPMLEMLAGVPTVVYGFFAILTVGPILRELGQSLGIAATTNSALTAGSVMGVMLIPFISSLSDDVINAVPQSLRDGSAALGATTSETVRQVVLPAALPGIVGAVLLAVSRAIGETMIVVMAAGLAANLTINPFRDVTTVTVQIVTNLTGDTEFDSAKTLSAFALGLLLFIVTLCLNVIALRVVKTYREKYD